MDLRPVLAGVVVFALIWGAALSPAAHAQKPLSDASLAVRITVTPICTISVSAVVETARNVRLHCRNRPSSSARPIVTMVSAGGPAPPPHRRVLLDGVNDAPATLAAAPPKTRTTLVVIQF